MQHFPGRITPSNPQPMQPIEDEIMFRPSTIISSVFSGFNYNGVSLFNPKFRAVLQMAVHG